MDEPQETSEYQLNTLKQYLSGKKFFIMRQFVNDGSIIFLKVFCESISEPILIYIPSKYTIRPDTDCKIPVTEIVDFDITETDMLSFYQDIKDEEQTEFELEELKDSDSFAEQYKPLDIDGKEDNKLKHKMIRYVQQLNKFKNCTKDIKYKFAIITEEIFCSINRHNNVDCYQIKDGKGVVPSIIDSKTNTPYVIDQDFYVLIDLPAFHEKISQIPDDLLKLYKSFYGLLKKTHVKQLSVLQNSLQTYNQLTTILSNKYAQKSKLLQEMERLSIILSTSITKEKQLMDIINILDAQSSAATMTTDRDRAFKLKKNNEELTKIREVKRKTGELMLEMKRKFNSFIISFDNAVFQTCKSLRKIEENIRQI